jgi:hypothetical protein
MIRTHDLNALAAQCGVVFAGVEETALSRMTLFSWRGRYLLPGSFKGLAGDSSVGFSPSDLEYYNALVVRLAKRLGFDVPRRSKG